MTARTKAQSAPPFDLTPEERLRVYTPQEVVDLKLLRCGVDWLKEKAYARKIPFSKQPGGIGFRLDQIWQISTSFDQLVGDYGRKAA